MIRDFQNHDIDTVMKIWLETNTTAHDFIENGYWHSNFDAVKNILPNATIFVYEHNGSVRGFISLMDSYIAGIFICNELQSKGIGKQLLNYVKYKYNELTLQVYKKNTRAVQFYLREGFTISKEQLDENTDEIEFVMNWSKL